MQASATHPANTFIGHQICRGECVLHAAAHLPPLNSSPGCRKKVQHSRWSKWTVCRTGTPAQHM